VIARTRSPPSAPLTIDWMRVAPSFNLTVVVKRRSSFLVFVSRFEIVSATSIRSSTNEETASAWWWFSSSKTRVFVGAPF